MWKASRVTADFAENVQVEAGTLLKTFSVASPHEPADADIVCATTGDFSITCVPETEDFFSDVNNVPNNTMEGKRINGWNCGLTVSCLDVTEATLKLALGAATGSATAGVKPSANYTTTDFQTLYWIGDMVDEDKLFVVVLRNTVSTGGLSMTTTKNGKGTLGLTLTPHASISNLEDIPMDFYLLEKVATTP